MENQEENSDNISRVFVGVLFPGVVKNDDKALECLGGLRSISQTYSNSEKQRLGVTFRPDNPHVKKCFGDIKTTFGVLLKVKVKKSVNGSEVNRQVVSTTVLGRVQHMYEFNALSDFQFLPIATDVQPPKCMIEDILPSGLDTQEKFMKSPAKHFLVPNSFTRSDKALCYAYTDKKEEGSTSSDNVHFTARDNRKFPASQVLFTLSGDLPQEPHEYYKKYLGRASQKFLQLYEILKEAFDERPIWSKNAVQYRTKMRFPDLKVLLPCISFITKNGPWKLLWIRYGYDPRIDREARKYQCLDFRLRQDAYLKSLVAKYTNKGYKRKVSDVKKPVFRSVAPMMETDVEATTEVTVRYRPGMIPTQRQIYYQYCDIELPEIEEMISQEPPSDSDCHYIRGWLAPGTNEKCREILTEYARNALLAASKTDLQLQYVSDDSDPDNQNSDCEPSTSRASE